MFTLPAPKSVALNFVGWQNERHYITYDSDETCTSQNLRSVDVVTGAARPLMEASFYSAIAYSAQYDYQAWEVIENQQGRVVVKVPGGDWQTVLEGDVSAMDWNPLATETLTIVLRDGSLYTASSPGFNPQLMGTVEGVNQIWVPLP